MDSSIDSDIPEALLAERLQIPRSTLSDYRAIALEKKTDWRKVGREVHITKSGIEKIKAALGSATPVVEEHASEIVELCVIKAFPNPKLIAATLPGSGEVVRVRVGKNVNFRPRMKIRARRPGPTGPQVYALVGRCPRYPGKW